MMYKFSYSLDEKDYLEFNRFHFNTASANRKITLLLRLFVPVMLIVLSLPTFVNHEDMYEVLISGVICVITSVIWFFAVKPLCMLNIKVSMKFMKKDGKLPYGKNVQIYFNEEEIHETTEVAESKVKYSNIEKIAEGSQAVYIYIGAAQAFIIPLSVFETEVQKNEFLLFINSKNPKRAR